MVLRTTLQSPEEWDTMIALSPYLTHVFPLRQATRYYVVWSGRDIWPSLAYLQSRLAWVLRRNICLTIDTDFMNAACRPAMDHRFSTTSGRSGFRW